MKQSQKLRHAPYCLLPIALRKSPRTLHIALSFLIPLLCACSPSTPVATTPGVPASLDDAHALDIATDICRHSQGSFPIWSLWLEYADYLLPSERTAFDYVSHRLARQFGPAGLAQYQAIDRFLVLNTECVLTETPKPGATVFQFVQKTPIVPNIAPPEPGKGKSHESLVQGALARLQAAYRDEVRELEITVRLVRAEGEEPVYPTTVAHTIAASLANSDFVEAMEVARLDLAQNALDAVCMLDAPKCAQLRPWLESNRAFQIEMAQGFARDVTELSRRMETVVPAGGSQHTVAELVLANHGTRPYSDIVMVTDERRAQYCTLEDGAGKPAVLEVGGTITAKCVLRADTMPTVPIGFWIAR